MEIYLLSQFDFNLSVIKWIWEQLKWVVKEIQDKSVVGKSSCECVFVYYKKLYRSVFTGGGGIFDETTTGIVKCHVGEEAVLRATIRDDLDINKDDVHLVW